MTLREEGGGRGIRVLDGEKQGTGIAASRRKTA